MNTSDPRTVRVDFRRLEPTQFRPERMKKLRVAVIGLGALGNELVKGLGLLGAGEVLLVDPDTVDETNLTRSFLYRTPAAIGRPKAALLAEVAPRWFPDTKWDAVEAEAADVGWGRLQGRDVLFCGLDRDSARMETARISTRLGIPVCDGGLGAADTSAGRVTWFPGAAGGCFCCRLTARRRRELLATWSSSAHPCHAAPESGGWASTPGVASMTAALQVEMGLRWLLRKEAAARSVEFSLDRGPRLEEISIPVNSACPFHAARAGRWEQCAGRFDEMLHEGEEARWEWPVCVRARCQDCAQEWAPRLRVVRFRREGRCPRCGSGRILEIENLTSVGRAGRWARSSPAELGLPSEHLYSIREGSENRGHS